MKNIEKNIFLVSNISKSFYSQVGILESLVDKDIVKPVVVIKDVSLVITRGETVGLIGESGSGKTTLAKIMLRLQKPDSGKGTVYFNDNDLSGNVFTLDEKIFRKKVQMIFQNPDTSLNSQMTVASLLKEAIKLGNRKISGEQIKTKTEKLLRDVGIEKREILDKKLFEIAGGERRRVGIARILAINPEFIVADEPIAEIDPDNKTTIISLLQKLKEENACTFLLISHDLKMIGDTCDRIIVMHKGRIIEQGLKKDVMGTPKHPYTILLSLRYPLPDKRILENEDSFCSFAAYCQEFRPNECIFDKLKVIDTSDLISHQCVCSKYIC